MKGCGNKLLSISTRRNLPLPRVHLERFMMTEGRIASSRFITPSRDFSPSRSQQCTDSIESSYRVRTHVKHPRLESQTRFFPPRFRQPAVDARHISSRLRQRQIAKVDVWMRRLPTLAKVNSMKITRRYIFTLCAERTKKEDIFLKYKINSSPYSACDFNTKKKSVCLFLH